MSEGRSPGSEGAGKPRAISMLSLYAITATPRPAIINTLKSAHETAGTDGTGKPVETSPTTLTP